MELNKAYVVAAKRTAVGSFNGALSTVSPKDLGVPVVKAVLAEAGIKPEDVNEVICGNVLSAGLGQNIARTISLESGIPQEVPAHSTNMVCGSGLRTIVEAAMSVQAGFNDVVLAGGVESMSQAPFLIPGKVRTGYKMGDMVAVDHMLRDGLTDARLNIHMGITAENVAEKYHITREMQDQFAYDSHMKAVKAIDAGKFKDEIVPITIHSRKGDKVVDVDEGPRRDTSLEVLAKLRTAFKDGGTVTAGNASSINDAASFCLIVSEAALKKYNLKPMCEIIGYGQGGVDPAYMGLGPVVATRNALKSCNLKLADMELMELNEAFAAQSLGVIEELVKEHGMDRAELMKRVNVNGGAIAIGHPIGASGNRIFVTLLHEMVKENKKLGLATLCIGGGQGVAVIVKR